MNWFYADCFYHYLWTNIIPSSSFEFMTNRFPILPYSRCTDSGHTRNLTVIARIATVIICQLSFNRHFGFLKLYLQFKTCMVIISVSTDSCHVASTTTKNIKNY